MQTKLHETESTTSQKLFQTVRKNINAKNEYNLTTYAHVRFPNLKFTISFSS